MMTTSWTKILMKRRKIQSRVFARLADVIETQLATHMSLARSAALQTDAGMSSAHFAFCHLLTGSYVFFN